MARELKIAPLNYGSPLNQPQKNYIIYFSIAEAAEST